MKIGISDILDDSGEMMSVKIDDNLLIPVENNESMCSVKGNIDILNAGDHLSVTGVASTDILIQCHRCLEDFKLSVDADISDTFVSLAQLTPEKQEELEEALESYKVYEGSEINLSDSLKEGILLSMPIKAICKEDCKGLCSACGQNLNENICNCETDDVDPRLEKLKDLFNK